MAVLRVNVTRDGVICTATSGLRWQDELAGVLSELPSHAPVCVLIHGYRLSWRSPLPRCNPQHRLYGTGRAQGHALRPQKADWAGWLGFSEGSRDDGLCIAMGWEARSTKSGGPVRSFSRIYRDALITASALGRIVDFMARRRPDLEFDMVAHSLGARVALQTLRSIPDRRLGRIILLGAAEYATEARMALDSCSSARVYHVMSRANDAFDGLFTGFAPPPLVYGDHSLGRGGLGQTHPRWLDIQLDLPEMRGWLAARGHMLMRQENVSHWHFYADTGAMSFYRAVLRQRPAHAIGALLSDGLPDRIEPRWSRLRARLPRVRRGGGLGPTASPLPNRG